MSLGNFDPAAPLVISYQHYYLLATLLYVLGLITLISRRNLVVMLMGLEVMLAGVNLLFLTFGNVHGITLTRVVFTAIEQVQTPMGEMFMIFITIVAAAEVAVGLAIGISYYRLRATADVEDASQLKH